MNEDNLLEKGSPDVDRINEGSIGRALWSMCWPLLASSFLVSSIGLVDLFLAGRMGEAAQAAVGIGEQVLCLTIIAGTGLATGTAAFVARYVGAGDHAMARSYAQDSLKASFVAGVVAIFFGLTLSRVLFATFQTDRLVAEVGSQYPELWAFGNLPFIVSCCLGAIFRSFGAPKYCLYIWLLTAGISIAGSFALAASPWRWCNNSVTALATAWDIGCLLGTSAGMIWLRKLFAAVPCWQKSSMPGSGQHGSMRRRLRNIAAVSIPAIVADSCWIFANFLVFRILSALPDATRAQAAWSIALKLEETFALMPLVALNLAAAVIVGQSLGAGNP